MDFDLAAADLRRNDRDIGTYYRVLCSKLMDTLPAHHLKVQRKLFSKDVHTLTVDLGRSRFILPVASQEPEVTHQQVVGGVAISSKQVHLDQFVDVLLQELAVLAREQTHAADILERLLAR